MANIPPLPEGFTLDQPQSAGSLPPLPAGFVLDQPQAAVSTPVATTGPVSPGGRRGRGGVDRAAQRSRSRTAYRPSIMGPTWGTEAETQGMADAGRMLLGVPDLVVSGVAGTAGTLADVAMGDLNERSTRWGAPRTRVGQFAANQVGETLAPAAEAASAAYDRMFGTGPLAETVKERLGQATEAVGGVTGFGLAGRSVVGAGREALAARNAARNVTPEQVLSREAARSGQSQGAAAASPDISNVSQELRLAVVQAGQQGGVNIGAVRRHVDAETLPVPVRLTEGQATGDVVRLSREQNMRGRAEDLARHFNEQNRALGENLHSIRDRIGPEVFSTNIVEHGDSLIAAYKALDERVQADVNAKYRALADANGGDIPVDGRAFVKDAAERLRRENKAAFLPPEVKRILTGITRRQRNVMDPVTMNVRPSPGMSFREFENLRTILAAASREAERAGNGNRVAAIKLVRDSLEGMPLTGDSARLKPLADAARQAARSRFEALEADPAYSAAIGGDVPPDRFVQKFVIGGTRDNLARMAQTIPEARQTLGVATLDYLRDQARIGPGYDGNFAAASYSRALRKLDPSLRSLLPQDAVEQLEQIGRVATYVTHQPRGSFVNNSNTLTAAAGDLAWNTAQSLPVVGEGVRFVKGKVADRNLRNEVRRITAPGAGVNSGSR